MTPTIWTGDTQGDELSSIAATIGANELKEGDYCFTFWSVRSQQTDNNVFRVTFIEDGLSTLTHTIPPSTSWKYQQFDLKKRSKDIKIAFQATVRGESASAIDDIGIYHGSCDTIAPNRAIVFDCTFESSFCGGANLVKQELLWSLKQLPVQLQGDASALTLETKASAGTGRFATKLMRAAGPACIKFKYLIDVADAGFGSLKVALVKGQSTEDDVDPTETVLEDQGHRGNDLWHRARYDVNYDGNFRLVFVGTFADGAREYSRNIAVRDLHVTRGACPSANTCDFNDDDGCLWQNLQELTAGDDNLKVHYNSVHKWVS